MKGLKSKIGMGLAALLLILGSMSCSKEEVDPGAANPPANSPKSSDYGKSISPDPLKEGLVNMNNYLLARNQATNGAFFNYTMSHPNYTYEELEQKGFIDLSYLTQELNKIKAEILTREEDDVVQIVNEVVDAGFISYSSVDNPNLDPPAFRICIFCCVGCMNGIKKDHCITQLFWSYGPGCDAFE